MGNRFKIIARLVTTQNYYIQIDAGSVTKKFTDESAPTNSAHSPPPGIDSDKEKSFVISVHLTCFVFLLRVGKCN
jgi:hypothetical protein